MVQPRDVAILAAKSYNYPDVGATRGELPTGYEHLRRTRLIGHGSAAWADASSALLRWELHRRAGLRVAASRDGAEAGVDVLLSFGVGPLRLSIPCRVVYMIDEGSRRGFAYGTLQGHPEAGEERFEVVMREDGDVCTEITAFSRPALWWSRLGSPVGQRVQAAVTRRYLAALA
jgi:uncharacterized protein (UPF0548 family)